MFSYFFVHLCEILEVKHTSNVGFPICIWYTVRVYILSNCAYWKTLVTLIPNRRQFSVVGCRDNLVWQCFFIACVF